MYLPLLRVGCLLYFFVYLFMRQQNGILCSEFFGVSIRKSHIVEVKCWENFYTSESGKRTHK